MRPLKTHVELSEQSSTAQALRQLLHGVSPGVLIQLRRVRGRLGWDVLEIRLRLRLLVHHIVDSCGGEEKKKNTTTQFGQGIYI